MRAARVEPLAAFFSFFAARFSSNVLVGFFLSSFFRSMPLPMTHSSMLLNKNCRSILLDPTYLNCRSMLNRRSILFAALLAAAQHFSLALLAGAAGPGMPARRIPRRFGRLLADPADTEFPAHHPHLLQFLEYLLRHAFRQVDEAMIFSNIHAADVHAFNSSLIGDRADDIAGLDTMN